MNNIRKVPMFVWQLVGFGVLLLLEVNWLVALICVALVGSLDASANKNKHNKMAVKYYMNNKK